MSLKRTESTRRTATATIGAPQSTAPVVRWAWLGSALMVFILYVLGRWLTVTATPTDPGPDPLPDVIRSFVFWVQVGTTVLAILVFWLFVVRPWRREGQLTTAGMLYLCWLTLFFQDPMVNYTSVICLYNSHMLNLGTWTLGATPGWLSPNGNHLPEPLLLVIAGYTILGYSLCFPVLAILNKIKEARPATQKLTLAVVGVLILIVFDTVLEILLLRTGVYAYPGSIRAITLFAGETYQFPMSEGIFYGGFTIGATMILLLYRDDRGQTFVERGLDKLRVGRLARQGIKFLALFGYVHLSMFLVFTVPMQWFALHADAFPQGYPSYMINGMCAYGPQGDQCPGPGVMMPRPPFDK